MDCEKYQDAMLDELYGELDDVTRAALRRHTQSCARCAADLTKLSATRDAARRALEPLTAPAGLEERILAATAAAGAPLATKVVPLRTAGSSPQSVPAPSERVPATLLSRAGRWAMRPQTAMAAVFLLMIGSSVVFMRGSSPRMSSVTVTERGAPADVEGAAASPAALASAVALANEAPAATAAPAPVVAATTTAPAAAASVAAAGPRASKGRLEEPLVAMAEAKEAKREEAKKTVALADEADPMMRPRPVSRSAAPGAPPPATAMAEATPAAATPPAKAGTASRGGDAFADAMAAYRAQRYSEALAGFDALAAAGDAQASLWAARTAREASGCAAAIARFDRVATAGYGSTTGYDATFDAGRCYRQLGSFDAARNRFARLLTVPSYAARAQAEIDAMTPRAKAAAKPAAAAPAEAQSR